MSSQNESAFAGFLFMVGFTLVSWGVWLVWGTGVALIAVGGIVLFVAVSV